MPEITSSLKDYEKFRNAWPFLHYLRPYSVQGTFRIAKNINYSGQKDSNTSIATDGSYLYVKVKE